MQQPQHLLTMSHDKVAVVAVVVAFICYPDQRLGKVVLLKLTPSPGTTCPQRQPHRAAQTPPSSAARAARYTIIPGQRYPGVCRSGDKELTRVASGVGGVKY